MRLTFAVIAVFVICTASSAQAPRSEPTGSADRHYYDRWPGAWYRIDGERVDSLPTFTVRRGPGNSFLEDWNLVIDGKRTPSFALRSWDPMTATWRLIWVSDPDHFQIWDGLKLPDGWYVVRKFGEGAEAFLSRQAWIPQGSDQLLRTIERSTDGGKTWTVRDRNLFRRIAGSSALKPINQAALQAMVDRAAKEFLVPGALVLLRTPQGEFTVTYGTTLRGATSPPRADTHFRIASNTKTMTAAVILQLAQEGKLSVGDPVSKYVPGVPNGNNITIAELLEMRSGLYNYTNAPEFSASLDHDPARVWTQDELLAIAFARPPNFPPGTAYEYCNTNYALLGLIAEKLDGKPLARAMQDRLFGPLGMRRTALPASTVNTMPEPYSHGYLYGSTSVALVGTPPYSPADQAAARAGSLAPNDYTGLNHSFATAAGGVISTANDLATWIQALVAGRVLNAAYQRRWLDSLRPEDPSKPDGQHYGFGISQMRWGPNAIYFHGGETPGYNSFIGYDPTNQVTLVVWTNLTVSLDDQPTANALMVKVLDQIYVVSPLPPP